MAFPKLPMRTDEQLTTLWLMAPTVPTAKAGKRDAANRPRLAHAIEE